MTRYLLKKGLTWLTFVFAASHYLSAQQVRITPIDDQLIYFDVSGLLQVQKRISEGDIYYLEALQEVTALADSYMSFEPDPVVNKSKLPPSGDKHDYLSISPYWWPDTTKEDGLPWIRRDGEVNPATRGNHTDKLRLSRMFDAVRYLTWAYWFTKEVKYADKAIDILRIWFVDADTRVNPNVNFGQGVPGRSEGRPFGIIEWRGVTDIVTAVQIFDRDRLLKKKTKSGLDHWMSSYAQWLMHSDLGKQEGTRHNNHATWYDYQVIGLLMYLGRSDEAKIRAESAKETRIGKQIKSDGSQPAEIARTKSLSYSVMNLRAMILVGQLAEKLDVDLLHYTSPTGGSLIKAVEFLAPYAHDHTAWPHQQISSPPNLLAFFSQMSTIYGRPFISNPPKLNDAVGPLQRLRYPPLFFAAK